MSDLTFDERQLTWMKAWSLSPKLSLHLAPRRSGKSLALARLAAQTPRDVCVIVACSGDAPYMAFVKAVNGGVCGEYRHVTRFDPLGNVDWSQPTLVLLDEGARLPDEYYDLLFKPAMASPNARVVGMSTPLCYPTWFTLVFENNGINDEAVKEALAKNDARWRQKRIEWLNEQVARGQEAQEALMKMYRKEQNF